MTHPICGNCVIFPLHVVECMVKSISAVVCLTINTVHQLNLLKLIRLLHIVVLLKNDSE